MRLICPNCSAQYEVDRSVIPEAGRDVQCSQCGHTWWQTNAPVGAAAAGADAASGAAAGPDAGPDAGRGQAGETIGDDAGGDPTKDETGAGAASGAPESDAPAKTVGAEPPRDDSDAPSKEAGADEVARGDDPAETADGPEAPAAETGEDALAGKAPDEEAGAPAGMDPPSRRPALDEAVMEMLREEAEREAVQRQIEGGAVESQGEFGLAGRGATAQGAGRSSRLPNIDDINSTLSGPQAAGGAGAPSAARRAKGMWSFRIGFSLMLFLATGVIVVYLQSQRISAAAPALAPSIERFTANVDAGRYWLDQAALRATQAIREMTDGN